MSQIFGSCGEWAAKTDSHPCSLRRKARPKGLPRVEDVISRQELDAIAHSFAMPRASLSKRSTAGPRTKCRHGRLAEAGLEDLFRPEGDAAKHSDTISKP